MTIFTIGHYSNSCYAQKRSLNIESLISYWPSISGINVNRGGSFIAYLLLDTHKEKGSKLMVKSLTTNWQICQEISKAGFLNFTADGENLLYFSKGDTLNNLNLKSKWTKRFQKVLSYKISSNRQCKWICLGTTDKKLVIQNSNSNRSYTFPNTLDYDFTADGDAVIYTSNIEKDSIQLNYFNLVDLQQKKLWKGKICINRIFNSNGNQLAFIEKSGDGQSQYTSVWNSDLVTGLTKLVYRSKVFNKDSLDILSLDNFLEDESKILLTLKGSYSNAHRLKDKINVVSSLNKISTETIQDQSKRSFKSVLDLKSGIINRLENSNETILAYNQNYDGIIVKQEKSKNGSAPLNDHYIYTSLKDNERNYLRQMDMKKPSAFSFSPNGLYFGFFDRKTGEYCLYDIRTKQISVLGANGNRWRKYADGFIDGYYSRASINPILWSKDSSKILLEDKFGDIWAFDTSDSKKYWSITGSLGINNSYLFQFLDNDASTTGIDLRKPVILKAYERNTKRNYFYKYEPLIKKVVMISKMDFACFSLAEYPSGLNGISRVTSQIIKIPNSRKYLIPQAHAGSLNYVVTEDFKNFKTITDNYPEREYNWIKNELVTVKKKDGEIVCGILYKPEDFDIKKKYPIIFHYYEKNSDLFNGIVRPELFGSVLNIPYLVSNGYLVFVPDLSYRIGDPGISAFECLDSFIDVLTKLPFVNSAKMGLQGFSYGGYETNFFITQTNKFKAACAGAGLSSLISMYTYAPFGSNFIENGQTRMGKPI